MEATQTPHDEALKNHRRETLLYILLPVAVGLLALVIILIIVMAASSPGQVSVVADFLMTVLVLCPVLLCALPFALGFTVLAVLMSRAYGWSGEKLTTVSTASYHLNRRIDRIVDRLGRAGVDIGAKTAPLEKRLFNVFDRPATAIIPSEARNERTPTKRNPDTPAESSSTGRVEK